MAKRKRKHVSKRRRVSRGRTLHFYASKDIAGSLTKKQAERLIASLRRKIANKKVRRRNRTRRRQWLRKNPGKSRWK